MGWIEKKMPSNEELLDAAIEHVVQATKHVLAIENKVEPDSRTGARMNECSSYLIWSLGLLREEKILSEIDKYHRGFSKEQKDESGI